MSEDELNLDLFSTPPAAEEGEAEAPAPLDGPPPLWVEDAPAAAGESVPASEPPPPAVGRRALSGRGPHAAVAVGTDATPGDPPPRDDGPKVWSVSQVNQGVRKLLEGTFPEVWVRGEIGRWTRHGSGHCYFTLKDERSQLRCVMFQRDAARLPMDPEEGMTIRVMGGLTLYEARGEYQLTVRQVDTDGGEGLWRLAFQRLQRKLDAEGLLAPERKRPVPRHPAAVGVVTSPSGAALRDILTVIGRRAPWTRVIVAGARVQGEGAAAEIAAAVDMLGHSGRVDALIVGRGGGSIEDLWAFNEEVVARAIAGCPVPVISAVGHEVDVTISDLVADLRAPTPSAAGEAAVPDAAALTHSLVVARERLAQGLRSMVAHRKQRVADGVSHLGKAARRVLEPRRQVLRFSRQRMHTAVGRMIAPRRRLAAASRDRLDRAVAQILDQARRRLIAVAGKMDALSPLATLKRGYAVPLDGKGRVLRSVKAFQPGTRFSLRVADGRVHSEALETEDTGEGIEHTE